MAEPEDFTHRLLREIRAKQDEHSDRLGRVETQLQTMNNRFDDLEREMAYALGRDTVDRQIQRTGHAAERSLRQGRRTPVQSLNGLKAQ